MPTFREQLDDDMAIFFNPDEFGESAVYNGADITVVEAEAGEQSTGSPGFVTSMFAVYVKAAEVARPKAGDVVVFRGITCRVAPYPRSEGGMWRVELIQETVQA